MLVRSTLHTIPGTTADKGFNPCGKCAACNHKHVLNQYTQHTTCGSTFTSSVTGETYTINHPLGCLSSNVIYLITCRKCQQQYVGETKRALKTCLLEHCGDTIHNRDKPVGRHFNKNGHSAADITIMAIDRPKATDYHLRLALDTSWIQKLKTSTQYRFGKIIGSRMSKPGLT